MIQLIHTDKAPAVVGSYSQAIRSGKLVFLAGQIPLDPQTMELVPGEVAAQVDQVFKNLEAVVHASGGDLQMITKLTVYLLDLQHIVYVNEAIARYFKQPYPARTSIGVKGLPKNAMVEVDAIMVLP